MKYINRHLEKDILERVRSSPVIALMGPRQSGKTTLAKSLFPDFEYVNLEFPEIRIRAEKDPRGFLSSSKKMIIDEAQRVPELFSYIQGFVDEDNTRKYILTGSANFLLMKNISQSLAGRVAIFKILPFSKKELESGGKIVDDLEEYMFKGCYPRVWVNEEKANLWYNDYIQTYLEKDIRGIHGVNLFSNFFIFLKLLANQVGNELNLSDLAKGASVNPTTVAGWLSLLEESFIIYKLRPEYNNFGKKLVKSPKIYFYDTGLVCSLLNITEHKNLKLNNHFGKLFENMVVSEIQKENLNKNFETTYYREYSGLEVDLLIASSNRKELIEIKSTAVYNNRDTKSLSILGKLINQGNLKFKLIYSGDQTFVDGKVEIMSWRGL